MPVPTPSGMVSWLVDEFPDFIDEAAKIDGVSPVHAWRTQEKVRLRKRFIGGAFALGLCSPERSALENAFAVKHHALEPAISNAGLEQQSGILPARSETPPNELGRLPMHLLLTF